MNFVYLNVILELLLLISLRTYCYFQSWVSFKLSTPWLCFRIQNDTFVDASRFKTNKNTLSSQHKTLIFHFNGDLNQDFVQFNFVAFPSLAATPLAQMCHFWLFWHDANFHSKLDAFLIWKPIALTHVYQMTDSQMLRLTFLDIGIWHQMMVNVSRFNRIGVVRLVLQMYQSTQF